MQTEIDKRWDEFRRESTDTELQWTERAHRGIPQGVLRLYFGLHEAEKILEQQYAKAGLEEGEHPLHPPPTDWMVYAPEKVRNLHIYKRLVNLRAYALYGLPVEDLDRIHGYDEIPDTEDERGSCISELLDSFLHNYMINPTLLFGDDIAPVIDAAAARSKLDGIVIDKLSLAEVAAVARMGLKSVKNATSSKSSDQLPVSPDGTVGRKDALRWLLNRRNFRASVWQTAEHHQGASVHRDVRDVGPVVFVPVTRDGMWFSPLQHRDGRYRVGPPTNPDKYETFDEALEALQRMEEPRWHEPTPGGWTVATGVQWMRIPRSELDAAQTENATEDADDV